MQMTLKVIEKHQREGVDRHFYLSHKNAIGHWRKERMIEQRREANASRRLKNNRKKLICLLLNRQKAISH